MSLPDVTVTILDGQLGILDSSSSNIVVKLGVCSAGAPNTLYSFGDKTALQEALGTGPMVEAAALSLDTAGGPIYCMPVNPSVAGSIGAGAVTQTGSGTSVLSLTGTAKGAYQLVVLVTTAVALVSSGTGAVSYSLDGGKTFSSPVVIPAGGTYLMPGTGVTLNFVTTGSLVAGDTYEAIGGIFHNGTGASALTISGTPLDGYQLLVTIVTGNALVSSGLVTFTYSLDGGNTTSPLISLSSAGTYAIPGTGITLNFSTGATAVAADTYGAIALAPSYSSTDLTNAVNALLANPLVWGFIHIVGKAASVTAEAALVAIVDTLLAGAAAAFRWAFAVMDCPKDTDANIIAAFASASSKRVLMAAGTEYLSSSISGLIRERSCGWVAAARCAQVPIHESLGRVATGPVVGIPSVVAGGASGLIRDEQVTPALDAQRLTTLRTIIGKQGFYITNGNMLAPSGSDFGKVERRRVMDAACTASRGALLQYLQDTVRVSPTTGLILESEAQAIESYVGGILNTAIVAAGHASAAFIHIDRTHNILSDGNMPVTVSVVPLATISAITETIGFVNPALVPAQAA